MKGEVKKKYIYIYNLWQTKTWLKSKEEIFKKNTKKEVTNKKLFKKDKKKMRKTTKKQSETKRGQEKLSKTKTDKENQGKLIT